MRAVTLAVIAACLVVGGCADAPVPSSSAGGQPTDVPSTSPATTTAYSAAASQEQEREFETITGPYAIGSRYVSSLARSTCSSLRAGAKVGDLIDIDSQVSRNPRLFVASSIIIFCPEFKNELPA
jgi:hypothetical protein